MNLNNRKALIIGGTGDIGHATAKLFIENGATAIITGRNAERTNARASELGKKATGFAVDPADEKQVQKLFDEAGSVDYVLLTLGTQTLTMPFMQLPEKQLVMGMEEKFLFYTRALRAGWGKVKESVTWLTGAAATSAVPGLSNYAAPNGALHAMMGPLAMELAPVRINCVAAGVTKTHFWANLGMSPQEQEGVYDGARQNFPLKRIAEPAQIAEAMFYAATNSVTTGSILNPDGGIHLGKVF